MKQLSFILYIFGTEGGEKRGDWGEAGVLQPDREID